MKRLAAMDALCKLDVVRVSSEEHPHPQHKGSALYAVYSPSNPKAFLGIVTEQDVAAFPQRIFADILNPNPPLPVTSVTPLNEVRGRMADESVEFLPVLDDGNFVGLISQDSLLEALFQREHALLEEIHRLNKLLKIKHERLSKGSKKQQRLDYINHFDVLTKLPNRTLFTDRLQQALTHAQRNNQMLAIMFLDLDNFKTVNDTMGQTVGDTLLKAVAERLTGCVREVDTVARLGGDQFTVLLTELQSIQDITFTAQKINEVFTRPFVLDGNELFTRISIGIAVYPHDDASIEELLKDADFALYHAKSQGKNDFQFFTADMNAHAQRRVKLERQLRLAIQRQEFFLHFQPQIELATTQVVGAEALLRWNDEDGKPIPPDEFIPIAEESGLIVPIGEWVLKAACAQNVQWQHAGLPPLRIAVNISAKQFRQKDFVKMVTDALQDTGHDPGLLELEITESMLIQNDEAFIETLHGLKSLGIHFSIDDFGTGYSSLSYLKRFPISVMKIDRSFVQDITSNPDDAAIAGAIISMAHSLKLWVIAEGVETAEQLKLLHEQDCDGVQGDFFAKPMLPADFASWCLNHSG